MGKGRQIAALVTENILRKRGRERVLLALAIGSHTIGCHVLCWCRHAILRQLLSFMIVGLQAHAHKSLY